jgi:hypothetical protein
MVSSPERICASRDFASRLASKSLPRMKNSMASGSWREELLAAHRLQAVGRQRTVAGLDFRLGQPAHVVDAHVQPLGRRRRDRQTNAADVIALRQAGQLRPVAAAVGALPHPRALARVDEVPRPALAVPQRGVHHVRVAGLEDHVGGTGPTVRRLQHLLPAGAAVLGEIEAAHATLGVERALHRDEDAATVARIDDDAGNAIGAEQARLREALAAITGDEDPEARVRGARGIGLAGADPDRVRVVGIDRDVAGDRRRQRVGERRETDAVVLGLPEAAGGVGDVEGVRLLRVHFDVDHAPALHGGADRPPLEALQQAVLFEPLVLLPGLPACLGCGAGSGGAGGRSQNRGDRQGKQAHGPLRGVRELPTIRPQGALGARPSQSGMPACAGCAAP